VTRIAELISHYEHGTADMCMKCGCCTPNDKINHVMTDVANGGSGETVIVPATSWDGGRYDTGNGY